MKEDPSLLHAFKQGSPAALESLFNTYADRLYSLAAGMLGDPLEAEDIVQTAFLKAITHLPEFEGRASIGTWLYRVAYNACLDRLRGRHAELLPEDGLDAEGISPAPLPAVLVEWHTPEILMMDGEARRYMETAIRALPDALRSAFLLRDVDELSTAEAAEVLGVSENLVKVRLHRARLALRERLALYFAEQQPEEDKSYEL